MRGEQRRRRRFQPLHLGSPPLARGTAAHCYYPGHNFRITPACAGNSKWICLILHRARDHPRLRGEQSAQKEKYSAEQGSPPLARGTAPPAPFVCDVVGITPACAGNSYVNCPRLEVNVDHPRLRGEQLHSVRHGAGDKGSPPLARGTVL